MMTCAIQQNRPCWAGEPAKLPHKPSSKGDFDFMGNTSCVRDRGVTCDLGRMHPPKGPHADGKGLPIWGPTYQLNAEEMRPTMNEP